MLRAIRNEMTDNFHHNRYKGKPDQRTDNIENCMCICNLSGDDLDLRPLRRNKLNESRKKRNKEREHDCSAYVEAGVCNGRSFGIAALSDACKKRRNRRSDVITEEDRNGTRKSDHAGAVRSRLRSKALQNSNGCRGGLHDKRHAESEEYAKNRNIPDLQHQLREDRTCRQRLHDGGHNLNSFEQKAKGKEHHGDVLDLFVFGNKLNHKADEQNRINIFADVKGDQLCRHRGSDVGSENNGNGLRQSHQSRADKADYHDGGGTGGLQNSCDQCSRKGSHQRILREDSENGTHLLARRLLQRFTHLIHSEQKNSQSAKQTEQCCNNL